jgi:hypothetical protein
MFSDKLRLQNQSGIQRLEQVGAFLVIANKQLYEMGKPRKFTLVNETEKYVHSVHGSQRAAVVYAQKKLT